MGWGPHRWGEGKTRGSQLGGISCCGPSSSSSSCRPVPPAVCGRVQDHFAAVERYLHGGDGPWAAGLSPQLTCAAAVRDGQNAERITLASGNGAA